MINAKVADPNTLLSKIEAKVKVVKKTTGVSSKNTKPATILLLKLFWDKEMAKKLRAPNITNENRRVINNWIPADISTAPFWRIYNLLYSKVVGDTPLKIGTIQSI